VADHLEWFVNEGETCFRQGDYTGALSWYEKVLALAIAESWKPDGREPHWAAYAAFRRAETLLLLGQTVAGRPAMQAVADAWPDDRLGDLARAFLTGYGAGGKGAGARGIAAMKELNLEDYFSYYRDDTLHVPIDAKGILFSGVAPTLPTPEWPRVGVYEMP